MRRPLIATLLTVSVFTALLPLLPVTAAAQQAPLQQAESMPRLDQSQLPPLPPVIPAAERNRLVLLATGAGAAIGVIVVDLVTGGMLLSPLGLPGAAAILTFGGGGAAVAAPTYSIAERLFASVATVGAAVGGGYVGAYVGKARPDIIRVGN
jgi:hypothetical protein